jgi:hypothetical protein
MTVFIYEFIKAIYISILFLFGLMFIVAMCKKICFNNDESNNVYNDFDDYLNTSYGNNYIYCKKCLINPKKNHKHKAH